MCGDLEEDDTEAGRLYAGFLQAAHTAIHESIDHRGGSRSGLVGAAGHDEGHNEGKREGEVSDTALHRYMDGLFGDILNACIKDARPVGEASQYRVLASQAVVLARLAGFLAGQLDLRSDPLRTSIEALMAGYAGEHDGHGEHGEHGDHSH
jgi:hypothetical protein